MIAVITGDVINSRSTRSAAWLKVLKQELEELGNTPRKWEIYRGDSFQAEVKDPQAALLKAVKIKAALKSLNGIDVRIAIGIGDKTHSTKSITESNGSAFVNSGSLAEELKKRRLNLAVRSNMRGFDNEINLYLKLALLVMDRWTTNAAASVKMAMQFPDKSQAALGRMFGIRQNAVSTRLKRARYYEIMEVLDMYRNKLAVLQ